MRRTCRWLARKMRRPQQQHAAAGSADGFERMMPFSFTRRFAKPRCLARVAAAWIGIAAALPISMLVERPAFAASDASAPVATSSSSVESPASAASRAHPASTAHASSGASAAKPAPAASHAHPVEPASPASGASSASGASAASTAAPASAASAAPASEAEPPAPTPPRQHPPLSAEEAKMRRRTRSTCASASRRRSRGA